MSRTVLILSFALVLLGFLASTTWNMYHDVEALRAENRKLSEALSQLSSEYKSIMQERDLLRSQNMELLKKNEMLQQAYIAENRARRKAETDLVTLQAALNHITKSGQGMPQTHAPESEQETIPTETLFGTGFVTVLATIGFGKFVIDQYRANKKRNKTVLQTRHFPPSIPKS